MILTLGNDNNQVICKGHTYIYTITHLPGNNPLLRKQLDDVSKK